MRAPRPLTNSGARLLARKKTPTIIVRLFNTVGPRQTGQYGMVIPTFVKQALAGRPITVYGDGEQQRCFGYVGDVVGALIKLMDRPEAVGQGFQYWLKPEITIVDLAKRIKELRSLTQKLFLCPTTRRTKKALKTCRAEYQT